MCKVAIHAVLAALFTAVASLALAHSYPTRPAKFLVRYPTGGAMDGISRIIGLASCHNGESAGGNAMIAAIR